MARTPPFTEADTHRFTTEARRIIAFARVLEWTVRWNNQNKNIAVLHSPIAPKTINIPTTNVNHNRVRSWVRQMLTYSSPASVMNLMEGGFDMVKEKDIASVVAAYGVELSEQVEQWKKDDEEKLMVGVSTVVAEAMREAQERAAERQLASVPEPEPDPTPPDGDDFVDGRRVVATRPWLAKKGGKDGKGGTVYESRGVIIITFEDGTETYKCKDCDRTSDNPRSIKMHHATAHVRFGKDGPPPPPEEPVLLHTDHYEKSDITHPNARAVRRLAHDLVMALDGVEGWQAMDAQQLADLIAHRVVENRPESHGVTEPLTDEQVLRRIEALVDRGRVADLHQQLGQVTSALDDSQQRLVVAEEEASKLRGERQALREMLAEES